MDFDADYEDEQEIVLPPITVSDLQESIRLAAKLKIKKERSEKVAKLRKAKYNALMNGILAHFQEHDMSKLLVKGAGLATIRNEYFVAYPKSQEDIKKFHDWLDENGRAHERKLNSKVLTSMIKEMEKQAKANEEPLELPPGLGSPIIKQKLTLLKG